jgi:hypothetical protein
MQPKRALIYTLAALITLLLFGTVAPATTIDIMQTFDYPGTGVTGTMPQKIEDQTNLVGTMFTSDGKVRAFIYKPLAHSFSPLLTPPFANHGPTQGRGINFRRHICGEYLNQSDGTFHGYVMTHPTCTPTPSPTPTPTALPITGAPAPESELPLVDDPAGGQPPCPLVFTQFDLTGALDTIPLGINNLGDIVGTAIFSDGTQPGFLSVHQFVTTFSIPNATATFAYQVNDSGKIVGYYNDSNGISHGYLRDAAGALTYPIDVPGATETLLLGNNASDWGVGRYTDTSGVTHGFFYVTPDSILTYDYPGATYTTLNGINKDGLICGYYLDAAGLAHGFVARANLTGSGKPNMNKWTAPVKPAYTLPQIPGIALPAL